MVIDREGFQVNPPRTNIPEARWRSKLSRDVWSEQGLLTRGDVYTTASNQGIVCPDSRAPMPAPDPRTNLRHKAELDALHVARQWSKQLYLPFLN
jgi:hypothetical protein